LRDARICLLIILNALMRLSIFPALHFAPDAASMLHIATLFVIHASARADVKPEVPSGAAVRTGIFLDNRLFISCSFQRYARLYYLRLIRLHI